MCNCYQDYKRETGDGRMKELQGFLKQNVPLSIHNKYQLWKNGEKNLKVKQQSCKLRKGNK
jgi:hypothetical protein